VRCPLLELNDSEERELLDVSLEAELRTLVQLGYVTLADGR
jgi:hypothetical protein